MPWARMPLKAPRRADWSVDATIGELIFVGTNGNNTTNDTGDEIRRWGYRNGIGGDGWVLIRTLMMTHTDRQGRHPHGNTRVSMKQSSKEGLV